MDDDFLSALNWVKKFNLPFKICKIQPKQIYNIQTHSKIKDFKSAIAFCAIGQPVQFFNFAKMFYEVKQEVIFEDHHKYCKNDIKKLIQIAKNQNTNTFITTQKDETKLVDLIKDLKGYCFNVLELEYSL